jgi:hypothetical protein
MSATWFDRDVADHRVILRVSSATGRRRGIVGRLRALFVPASQREAHQHMARLLRRSGGRLTAVAAVAATVSTFDERMHAGASSATLDS